MLINILTAGFSSPNGRAFLMPLLVHQKQLRDKGITIRLFHENTPDLTECDFLMVDSKFHSPRWASDSDGVLAEFARLREKNENLIFVDILDSAGWDHARVLPHVKLYCKAQLLRDRRVYLKPLYGYRAFSDYYRRAHNVEDDNPVFSEVIEDEQLLNKLTLSWNSGLADYSWLGPYRMTAYKYLPWQGLLNYRNDFLPPAPHRAKDMSCRIGTSYIRQSVAWQRVRMAEILRAKLDTVKLSRRRYIEELQKSRLVISPFGLGEITLRDFEIFMAGSLLFKPDMSHMETWPNFYEDGATMVAHSWDLDDLEEKLDHVLSNYQDHLHIAEEGQERYRKYLGGPHAGELFAAHFTSILDRAECVT